MAVLTPDSKVHIRKPGSSIALTLKDSVGTHDVAGTSIIALCVSRREFFNSLRQEEYNRGASASQSSSDPEARGDLVSRPSASEGLAGWKADPVFFPAAFWGPGATVSADPNARLIT